MDYFAHYDRLIARASGRVISGYKERHHVLPKCMGGGNEPENLVELTAEEHFVAHELLVKMYPDVPALAIAVVFMAKQCGMNKAYGWLRRRAADGLRGNTHALGIKHSPETRAKVSASMRGNTRMLGKSVPQQTREKMSSAHKGRVFTQKHKAKIGAAHRGKKRAPLSLEHRAKISAGLKGRIISSELRSKLSAANIGKSSWLGKRHSQETRNRMSASRLAYFARVKNAAIYASSPDF